MDLMTAGRILHESVRAFNFSTGGAALPPFEESMFAQELSMETVRWFLQNPAMSGEENHYRWVAHRMLTGWRPGPFRDDEAMINPNLVGWGELDPVTRAKNEIVVATLRPLVELIRPERQAGGGVQNFFGPVHTVQIRN